MVAFRIFSVLIQVGYEMNKYITTEGGGEVNLSIVIFDPPSALVPRPFTLSVSTSDGTAGIYIKQPFIAAFWHRHFLCACILTCVYNII